MIIAAIAEYITINEKEKCYNNSGAQATGAASDYY